MKKRLIIFLLGSFWLVLGFKSYQKLQVKSVAHTEQKADQFYTEELERKFYTP